MSTCILIASDMPLAEHAPSREYPVIIDINHGTVDDGGADDNYGLNLFDRVGDYTDRDYGVCLEWNYTEGRAEQIVEYLKAVLRKTESVELWKVWLMDCYEFEDRPYIHRKKLSICNLTTANIKEIDDAVIWNTPDRMYPERPSFYCLTITR